MKVVVKFLLLFSIFISCHENEDVNERSVVWSRSTFTEPDTIPWGPDSTFSNYNFHMLNFIQINEMGNSILIKRDSFGAPRNIYNIQINDSLKRVIFELILDTTIINYKDPKDLFPPDFYCGPACSFYYIYRGDTTIINYLPIDEETNIYKLHILFENIFDGPCILANSVFDTIKLDIILKNNIKDFYPPPAPMRPSVHYIPPKIK